MRLALISPYPAAGAQPDGGVAVNSVRVAAGMSAHGVDVTVIAPGAQSGEEMVEGIHVIRIAEGGRLSALRLLRPWRREVRRVLDSLKPDVVHGQGLLPAGLAATDRGIPCPRIVTVHGDRRRDTMALYRGVGAHARAAMGNALGRAAAARASAIVGVHPDWRLNVPQRPARFVYIPNVVGEPFFTAVRRPEPGRVLYCGGARRIKGWDVLAESWPRVVEAVHEARLEVVGWPAGVSWPPDAAGGAVEVRGVISSAQLREAMERASLLVVPSRFEIAPIVIAEAWAAGLPVVASSVGGLTTLADRAATLVPPDSPGALADAVVRVLRDPDAASEFVRIGSERAQANRAGAVVDAHLALYSELAAA